MGYTDGYTDEFFIRHMCIPVENNNTNLKLYHIDYHRNGRLQVRKNIQINK